MKNTLCNYVVLLNCPDALFHKLGTLMSSNRGPRLWVEGRTNKLGTFKWRYKGNMNIGIIRGGKEREREKSVSPDTLL